MLKKYEYEQRKKMMYRSAVAERKKERKEEQATARVRVKLYLSLYSSVHTELHLQYLRIWISNRRRKLSDWTSKHDIHAKCAHTWISYSVFSLLLRSRRFQWRGVRVCFLLFEFVFIHPHILILHWTMEANKKHTQKTQSRKKSHKKKKTVW